MVFPVSENAFMRVRDYVQLTSLSRTKATSEFLALSRDPALGITSRGSRSSKVYVLK